MWNHVQLKLLNIESKLESWTSVTQSKENMHQLRILGQDQVDPYTLLSMLVENLTVAWLCRVTNTYPKWIPNLTFTQVPVNGDSMVADYDLKLGNIDVDLDGLGPLQVKKL